MHNGDGGREREKNNYSSYWKNKNKFTRFVLKPQLTKIKNKILFLVDEWVVEVVVVVNMWAYGSPFWCY